MDPLAHWRRLGLPHGSDISDDLLVERAGPSDPYSARYIYQLCYLRLKQAARTSTHMRLLAFLDLLGFSESSPYDLDNCKKLPMTTAEFERAVAQDRDVFGEVFTEYLLGRLSDLRGTRKSRRGADPLKGEKPLPLSAAFHLRLPRSGGRSTEIERNYEIAEGVERIRLDLKRGRLRERALLVLADDSKNLFESIEKHLTVVGYRGYGNPSHRTRLAATIADITSQYGKNAKTAARIFIECMKTRQALLTDILEDDELPPLERTHLKEQIHDLNSYGAALPGKGKAGIGLSGIQRVHKDYKSELPEYFAGVQSLRDDEKSATLLAENHSAIMAALDVINSPNVGNHSRAALLKLQRQTPKEHQHVWRELWNSYFVRISDIASRQNAQ